MRTRITFAICLCLLFAGRASAQWVVSDPGNLAQGIINASKNIIHTSKTAANMVNNFQETVKIYESFRSSRINCSDLIALNKSSIRDDIASLARERR